MRGVEQHRFLAVVVWCRIIRVAFGSPPPPPLRFDGNVRAAAPGTVKGRPAFYLMADVDRRLKARVEGVREHVDQWLVLIDT